MNAKNHANCHFTILEKPWFGLSDILPEKIDQLMLKQFGGKKLYGKIQICDLFSRRKNSGGFRLQTKRLKSQIIFNEMTSGNFKVIPRYKIQFINSFPKVLFPVWH